MASVTDMDIRASFLPHDDPEASLAFYRDVLGFEVRGDTGRGGRRRITVGPAGGPSVVLHPVGEDPGLLLTTPEGYAWGALYPSPWTRCAWPSLPAWWC